MKSIIGVFVLVFALTGCTNQNANDKDQSPGQAEIQKHLADSLIRHKEDSLKKQSNKLYKVSGTIKYKKIWCGGVQIRPGDPTFKTRNLKNKIVFLIQGNINSDTCKKLQVVRTDADGDFIFEVKPGIYGIIVEDWKQSKLPPSTGERQEIACLRREYKKPDLLVKVVDASILNLKYTVIGYCPGGNPCNPMGGTGRP